MTKRHYFALALGVLFSIGVAIASLIAFFVGVGIAGLVIGALKLYQPRTQFPSEDDMIDITPKVRESNSA